MITKQLQNVYRKSYRIINSAAFFKGTVVFFIIQAVWIAFSNSYPLPFDEYYHFGLIDLYSRQWIPFISHQPDYAAAYGDVTRNGSYLFHYLMSFPYRIVSLFTDSFVAKVIIFRLINIALFVVGLYLFRKLLIKLGISKPLTHFTLLCFILIPIVPLLAAQSNYDNMIMILIPAVLLIAVNIIESNMLSAKNLLVIISLLLLMGIIKYTLFPIALAVFTFLAILLAKRHGKQLFSRFWKSLIGLNRSIQIATAVLLFISLFLFSERYVTNIIKYRNPQPECIAVQSYDVCSQYSPWIRNQRYLDRYRDVQIYGPYGFTKLWAPKMINDAFIAFTYIRVDPVSIRSPLGDVRTKEALSIPKAVAKIVFVIGVFLVLLNFGKLWSDTRWRMVFAITVFYVIVLWSFNYTGYRQLRHVVAIQPRYMMMLAPLIMGAMAKSFSVAISSRKVKAALATIAIIALMEGGGASIYIIRSYSAWYWPNNTIVWVNLRAREVLNKFTIVR